MPEIPEAPIPATQRRRWPVKRVAGRLPFVATGVSQSVALCMLMTQMLRCAMEVSPLLAVSATAPSSGKSHLVDLGSRIAPAAGARS